MEILISIFIFLGGLLLLIFAAGWLIQGSVKLAYILRLTPFFIGLILVAFGTSAPEAGVGIIAAIKGQEDIALGNIIGSNIANIGLILGLCAFLKPLRVEKSILRREVSAMLFSALLLYSLSADLIISRWDGVVFIICFILFCIVSYRGAKKSFSLAETDDFKFGKLFKRVNSQSIVLIFTLLALLGVILGAELMVKGGVNLARTFGISPWIIGITVFAVGTSLPELVASLTASFKKVPSISIGNIVGSNIFNILLVLGIVSLIRPIGLRFSALTFELPALVFFSFILFTVMRTAYKISRREGLFMLLFYSAFIFFLLRQMQ